MTLVHQTNRDCFSCSDEAGPGPVKSKYDALDFDALLKEAQRSLHRWHALPRLQRHALSETRLSTSTKALLHVYILNIGI